MAGMSSGKRLKKIQITKKIAKTVETLVALSGYIITTTPRTVRKVRAIIRGGNGKSHHQGFDKNYQEKMFALFLEFQKKSKKSSKKHQESSSDFE